MLERLCLQCLWHAGQFDAQDGVATQEAWLATLPWAGQSEWRRTPRRLWAPNLLSPPGQAELQSELHDVQQVGFLLSFCLTMPCCL